MALKTAQMLIDELEPIALSNGIELVTIELVGSKKAPTIRVFIDCDGGIGFDQIMDAHVWIDDYFDRTDPFPGAYTLEVSSPGIDRPLRKLKDFERFCGEVAVISTAKEAGRCQWTGKLAGVSDNIVLLELDGKIEELPFDSIRKAHIKGQIDFSKDERDR